MLRKTLILFLLIFPLATFAQTFGGNPSSIQWEQINTEKVRVIFPTGLDSQANRIANIVRLLGSTTAATIGGIQRKWNIILQNQTTIPNAYVRMAPVMSELYMTPDRDNFSNGSIRWDDNLIIHEDRHIQQFSNFNTGIARLFHFFLGQEGQLLANGIFIPNYFFEGDAVWQETLVSAQGRGRMPSFYNGFKSLWQDHKQYSWMKIRNGSYKDYIPDHYPLGYMMTAYGYENYGQQFWRNVTHDALHLKGFKRSIRHYSGKNYQQFYQDAFNQFKKPSLQITGKITPLNFITPVEKNNVVDYRFPAYIQEDSIIVSKQSYKEPDAFYLLTKGHSRKIRIKDLSIDDHFSYRNGLIVYASFQSDPRWGNRDYSVIKLLSVKSGIQRQLTFKTKYFLPDINETGSEIIAVNVLPGGNNNLVRLDANSGKLIATLPNPHNYFFTQTKYIDLHHAVSAIRDTNGKMALSRIDLGNGETELLTPFTYNVMGYPFVKGDTVYFSFMDQQSDKVFALLLSDHRIFRVTNNVNGIYQPVTDSNGQLLVSTFSSSGYRLASIDVQRSDWQEISTAYFSNTPDLYTAVALKKDEAAGILYSLKEQKNKVSKYKKSFRLFNYHSWRPVVNDPEFGYAIYSDNVLSSFSNSLSYQYNRSDKSHGIKFSEVYAGWYPVLSMNVEGNFDRIVDTAIGKTIHYNTAKLQATVGLPLSFIGGRSNKYINISAGYNFEPFYYRGVGKNVFNNRTIQYMDASLSFINQSRKARQNIYPHWAQSIALTYRDAFNYSNSHKLVANSAFYFPGIFTNHSLVLNVSYQIRDSLPDLFSKTFAYSRGYEALSTRRMYKFAINYQLPVIYPDWGFANLVFFQRIRGNVFYDETNARARVNSFLTDIKNRSTGAELFFDTKIWNELPVSIGLRFSHLLDTDLINPTVKNRWEIILPIGLIPE